jgi:hypothetical protein
MARLRKTIKPHIEKYKEQIKRLEDREIKEVDFQQLEKNVSKFLKEVAIQNNFDKVTIQNNETLSLTPYRGTLEEQQKILLTNKVGYLYGTYSFDWRTTLLDNPFNNWGEYFKREFRFVMDFEKADTYVKELFGESYKGSASKGRFSISPDPKKAIIKEKSQLVFEYIQDFLTKEEIEFSVDENKIIIDMNQFKDFTNLKELKEKEEIEKQELLKQQMESEIEKKQQELENLKKQLASTN